VKIVVTGGAGFIGSAVCRYLVQDAGAEVVNVDKLTYAANLRSLDAIASNPLYTFIRADICDRDAMDAVFARHVPDAVIHLAAESHVDRSINGSDAFIRTNVLGTHMLLEAARVYWMRLPTERATAFRFLHVSTDEVYGSLGPEGSFSEETAYDPSSPYAASKASADHLAGAWHRTFGLPVVISNCSNNYGPYQFPEKLVPLIILNALEENPLPVYGDGSNVRDWLYVEDHARALCLILAKGRPGEKYNVGGRNERTNLAVVETICDMLDRLVSAGAPRRRLISFVPDRPGHDHRYAINPEKLERDIGWRAEHDFDSGLARTVRWYLDNRAWWEPLRKGVYSGERLGLIKAAE
jgi:dTDP-glucose 4,6-dehydratase